MKYAYNSHYSLILLFIMTFLSSCSAKPVACPPVTGTSRYLTIPPEQLPAVRPAPEPVNMKIGNISIMVNKVVSGPLCNDSWSGTVYVTCNVQVYQWEEKPTFLKNCELTIAPGTVVYVAYHNNTAYYQGCSCHTGESATP